MKKMVFYFWIYYYFFDILLKIDIFLHIFGF